MNSTTEVDMVRARSTGSDVLTSCTVTHQRQRSHEQQAVSGSSSCLPSTPPQHVRLITPSSKRPRPLEQPGEDRDARPAAGPRQLGSEEQQQQQTMQQAFNLYLRQQALFNQVYLHGLRVGASKSVGLPQPHLQPGASADNWCTALSVQQHWRMQGRDSNSLADMGMAGVYAAAHSQQGPNRPASRLELELLG